MSVAPDRVELGEIVGVFGVRGEVRVFLLNPTSDTLRSPRPVWLVARDGTERKTTLVVRSGAGKRLLGRIDGIHTPEVAATLKGMRVLIDRALLPPPDEGEYYVHDLLGLPVFDTTGASLGVLAEVVAGPKDIWVVTTTAGDAFVLATPDNLVTVDVPGRRIVLAEGALSAPGDADGSEEGEEAGQPDEDEPGDEADEAPSRE